MKTTTLLIVSALTAFGALAQSKKKVNAQLLTELAVVQRTADSIDIIHGDNQRDIRYFQGMIRELSDRLNENRSEEGRYRSKIQKTHASIMEFGFDANTIVSLSELDATPSPFKNMEPFDHSGLLNSAAFIKQPEIDDLTELKLKVQNELLKSRIAESRAVNDKNRVVLAEEQKHLLYLKRIKSDYTVLKEVSSAFNKDLAVKLNTLRFKQEGLTKAKREEERLKEQKAIEAAYKAKSKKSKGKFEPPVIVEVERNYEYYDMEGDRDMRGYEFAEPPPPPPEYQKLPEIYDIVEETADYPGGRQAMMDYLKRNMKMPVVAQEMGINGKVYLKFIVSTTGSLSDITVKKGITDCKECDEEAIRLVKAMPDWIPAKNNGKVVKSYFTLPVVFKVQ